MESGVRVLCKLFSFFGFRKSSGGREKDVFIVDHSQLRGTGTCILLKSSKFQIRIGLNTDVDMDPAF